MMKFPKSFSFLLLATTALGGGVGWYLSQREATAPASLPSPVVLSQAAQPVPPLVEPSAAAPATPILAVPSTPPQTEVKAPILPPPPQATGPKPPRLSFSLTAEQLQKRLEEKKHTLLKARASLSSDSIKKGFIEKDLVDIRTALQNPQAFFETYRNTLHETAAQFLSSEKEDEAIRQAKADLAQGKTEKAQKLLAEIVAENKDGADKAAFQLAGLALVEIDHEKAFDYAQKAQKLNPANPLYLNLAGREAFLTGHDEASLLFYQRELEVSEKKGAEDPQVAVGLTNLAGAYFRMGNLDKAEPLYQRALSIREKKLGAEDPKTAMSLNSLGSLYRSRGDFSKAISFYERALSIFEKKKIEDTRRVDILRNMAFLYQTEKKPAKAESFYNQALSLLAKAPEGFRLWEAQIQDKLVGVYEAEANPAKAREAAAKAAALYKGALGLEQPETIRAQATAARLATTSDQK